MIIVVIISMMALFVAGFYFYRYTSKQLYQESVSQLEEISQQLFEKLEIQIDVQWDYLGNLKALLNKTGDMSVEDLSEQLSHVEEDLGSNGDKLYFRAIDEEGYCYTNEGRVGLWSGLDKISGLDKQCFVITSWLENENYMAFVVKADSLHVDEHEIKYLVLLRSMSDMQVFFHSSAFNNNNVAYVIDYDGLILAVDGSFEGINFEGKNLFHSLREQTYPHMNGFDEVLEKGYPSGTVCTDVLINGEKYYLIYDRLPSYDWACLLLVSGNDVAVSTANLVTSLLRVFITFTIILISALILICFFVLHIRNEKEIMAIKEEYARELEDANSKLRISQKKAEDALVVAESATRAKSQFLANMSHDIRTPMNAIIGMTNLMMHEVNNPDKLSYYIKKLQTSGQHMLGLINDILDMSKIESGDVELNLEKVKLAEQVGQIESIIRSQSEEKKQSFSIHVHEIKHEYLIGDTIRLRQIFLNLLTNAVKYTPSGGSISFDIKEVPCEKEDYATIITSVIDNGIGMSEEFLKHIFEPFTRETTTLTNKVQGTGLGMSITKNLVDLMGGKISVVSKTGEGSRFEVTLTLPIDKDVKHDFSVDSVLLVSDDEVLSDNIKASLDNNSISLFIVKSFEDGLAYLKEKEVDVVLLSGYLDTKALTLAVSKLKEVKDNLLIFCCDYVHKESVRDALIGSGVDGLIARPFFFENLMLAVEHSRKGDLVKSEDHHTPLSGKKFLCAEDNTLNAEILEALLSIHGASCKICPDGKALVDEFINVKQGDYDAILMDVQMPRMNGMEATKAIRTGTNTLGKTIPIIAMTANAFSSDVEECINAGMDAHLAKPLDITALMNTLGALLNKDTSGGGLPIQKTRSKR